MVGSWWELRCEKSISFLTILSSGLGLLGEALGVELELILSGTWESGIGLYTRLDLRSYLGVSRFMQNSFKR